MRSHSPAVSSGPGEPGAKIPALAKEIDDGHPIPPQVVPRSGRTPVVSQFSTTPEIAPVVVGESSAPARGYPLKRGKSRRGGATFSLGDPALVATLEEKDAEVQSAPKPGDLELPPPPKKPESVTEFDAQ